KESITSVLLQTIKGQKTILKHKPLFARKDSNNLCKKNNTRNSNIVPHHNTSLARQCLTLLSRQEAVMLLRYGHSWFWRHFTFIKLFSFIDNEY
ncbi:hypothetical protein ACHAW6_001432, partial [Cyclotella cf. meneghiniana]